AAAPGLGSWTDRFSAHAPQGKNWVSGDEAAEKFGEATDEETDGPLKSEGRRCCVVSASAMTSPTTLQDFEAIELQGEETTIFLRRSGSGPAVLLLHGFPQTHLMWRSVAPLLARRFTVICADLRGYGRSGCPRSAPDHAPYAKRVMARDMVSVMEKLGFQRFSVAGHDRGGRAAYRLALDHPERVERLALL